MINRNDVLILCVPIQEYIYTQFFVYREAVKGWRQASYKSIKRQWNANKNWSDYKHPDCRDNNATSKDTANNAA